MSTIFLRVIQKQANMDKMQIKNTVKSTKIIGWSDNMDNVNTRNNSD